MVPPARQRTACDRRDLNEMLDYVSARPVSSHPHLAALKLVAVCADEIFSPSAKHSPLQ